MKTEIAEGPKLRIIRVRKRFIHIKQMTRDRRARRNQIVGVEEIQEIIPVESSQPQLEEAGTD